MRKPTCTRLRGGQPHLHHDLHKEPHWHWLIPSVEELLLDRFLALLLGLLLLRRIVRLHLVVVVHRGPTHRHTSTRIATLHVVCTTFPRGTHVVSLPVSCRRFTRYNPFLRATCAGRRVVELQLAILVRALNSPREVTPTCRARLVWRRHILRDPVDFCEGCSADFRRAFLYVTLAAPAQRARKKLRVYPRPARENVHTFDADSAPGTWAYCTPETFGSEVTWEARRELLY